MRQRPPGDASPRRGRRLLESYQRDPRGQQLNKGFIPSRDEIIEVLQLLFELFYPGYFGRQDLSDETTCASTSACCSRPLREKLARQIELCLCYEAPRPTAPPTPDLPRCRPRHRVASRRSWASCPSLRALLLKDVQAAFDGDPAARSLDEVILAYPGLLAVTVYRVAHELHGLGVPLMPRIMTEWAHAVTGCDIHPGATIGESFFIDHATGVVVGETSHIGDHVKLYQGVTLGALSTRARPRTGGSFAAQAATPRWRTTSPVYANATVLGGETVLGCTWVRMQTQVSRGKAGRSSMSPTAGRGSMRPTSTLVPTYMATRSTSRLKPTTSSPATKGPRWAPTCMTLAWPISKGRPSARFVGAYT
jgi:serine O-acetyltransferase